MTLNLPDMENLFPHSKEFKWGGGHVRPGQATIVVALDGSGDTSSIQEGIDLLPDTGGVVFIKEGIYTMDATSNIDINKNDVALVGTGKGTKLVQTANKRIIFAGSQTGITIRDLWIYGTAGTGNNIQDGIRLNDCSNCIIDNCWIEKCDVDGIIITGTALTNMIISNCRIWSNDNDGIKITSYPPVSIMGNTCWLNNHGIEISSADNCIISDNDCYANTASGIHLVTADYNILTGNYCTTNDIGINVSNAGCDENTIMSNIVRNNTSSQVSDSGTNTEIINKMIDIDHDALTNFTATEHFTMLDEDDLASDSATQAATQQSIKAYADGLSGAAHNIADHADTTATGAELETLTDTSDADALHVHSLADTHIADATKHFIEAAITHDNIIAGTIASHDTSATGAELDTLTDGSDASALHVHTIVSLDTDTTGAELTSLADNSMVDTLHRHSELSASDGTPDQAVVVDATGKVGIGVAVPEAKLAVGGAALIGQDQIGEQIVYLGTELAANKVLILGYNSTTNKARFRIWGDASPLGLNIVDGGDVGIGTTTPGYKLDVDGWINTKATTGGYRIDDTGGTSRNAMYISAANDLVIGNSNYADIHLIGDVGVGVNDPHSKLEVAGAISSATATITASADNTDVSGINTLFINITGDIVLGGLQGGVDGQFLNIVMLGNFTNHVTIEHAEGVGTQDFINHTGADELISHGGSIYVCNGSDWYDTSHAKHV